MTRADTPLVATMGTLAFGHDELFSWLFPRQDEYPSDLRRWELIRIKARLLTPGVCGVVGETEPQDAQWEGKSQIIAFAFWQRHGGDIDREIWQGDSIVQSA